MDLLSPAAAWLRRWAMEQALPLWAGSGFDLEHGRFEERLTLRGERIAEAPIRLMVQARQIYSYSLAARRQWSPIAGELVELTFASMIRDFHRRDGRAGWIFSIGRDGSIVDSTRDLYAHDFVLLAVSAYVQLTGKREALGLADETLAYIDAHLRAWEGGGFFDSDRPADALRRQNPHMHMFEGLLSLWSASGERRYLERAAEMCDLFTTRFFHAAAGVLGEYFDARLAPAAGVIGQIVEPGHHYEWIWLLRWFERETGRSLRTQIDALYAHADTHGHDKAGLIVDELLANGTTRKSSRRVWPMTEAIKANVAEAALGRPGAAEKAAGLVGLLGRHFLEGAVDGGWIDRLDEEGACCTDFMPASTLYHILCALGELDTFVAAVKLR